MLKHNTQWETEYVTRSGAWLSRSMPYYTKQYISELFLMRNSIRAKFTGTTVHLFGVLDSWDEPNA